MKPTLDIAGDPILAARAALWREDLSAAADILGAVLAERPDDVDALTLFGACLYRAGQNDEAVPFLEKAVALRPGDPEPFRHLGAIAKAGEQAFAQHLADLTGRRCSRLQANVNRATLLLALGDAGRARQFAEAALKAPQVPPQAHHCMAHVLLAANQGEDAEPELRQAIAKHPAPPPDWSLQLSQTLILLGRPAEALEPLLQASLYGWTPTLKHAAGQALAWFQPKAYDPLLADLTAMALDEGWHRPDNLGGPAVALLHKHLAVQRLLARGRAAGLDDLRLAADIPLLRVLAEVSVIPNYGLERALGGIRRAALAAVSTGTEPGGKELGFLCSLAMHCFTNEYVFLVEDEERHLAAALRGRVESQLGRGEIPSDASLLCCATYAPLNALAGHERLAEAELAPELRRVVAQQILEPRIERMLADGCAPLGAIADEVSREVRAQYEANPYPRWTRSGIAPRPMPPTEGYGPLPHPFPAGQPSEILIAGCGTGLQSVEAASRHRGCRVTAIDLSRASLGYAMRKAHEARLGNILHHHADILSLQGWDRRFHVIECSGVLHHMRDPMQGWRILADLLLPGGLMKIALYSETARGGLVAAQRFIRERGFAADPEGIRAARTVIAALPPGDPIRDSLTLTDFYSTSACRDLLFHTQELRFTIPMIKAAVAELGLEFLGFGLEPAVIGAYRRRFPADPTATDLDNWAIFEAENPRTFLGMYQFKLQKRTEPTSAQ